MAPLFESYQIRVFALSKDTEAEALFHQKRDGLKHITLLSDPDLKNIRAYGLEHHKALEFVTWEVLGLPLGYPRGFRTMAIPTTLLMDEEGIVRWIDQADDYRQRGDQARIKDAITQVFGE